MKPWTFLWAAILTACGGTGTPPDPAPARAHSVSTDHRHGPGHHHDFSDVERFAAIFDAEDRDAWQRPVEVISLLTPFDGAVIADLGAGTGYFTPHLSRAVGAEGRVLAIDTEPNMIEHMRRRFRDASLENATALLAGPDDPGLETQSVDRVLVVDTWHHLSDRVAYARRLRDALRPNGSVVVVDFTHESPHGPPPRMRLTAAEVEAELSAAGFEVEVLVENLPFQYVVRGQVH